MCDFPLRRVGVSKEHSGLGLLNAKERVALVDLLCEEVRFGESSSGDSRVISVVDCASHIGSLENRAIVVEKSLMVAQVVGENLEEVSYVWKTLRTGNLPYCMSIDCDGDSIF